MKNTPHHSVLLILALSVTILVGAVYGYMHYVVKISIARAATARDIVALEKANKGREQGVRALHERTAIARASLSQFFIPADRVVEFIEAIEALGPQTGSIVTLSSIDDVPPGQIKESKYGLARAHVEARGSWSSVMRALSLAENFPYAISVQDTRVDSEGKSGGSSWKAEFTLEVLLSAPLSSTAETP